MSESLKYDTRVIRHQIRRGVTTEDEYKSYLDGLDDCADLAEETETRFDNPYEKRHTATEEGEAASGTEPAAEA